MKLRRRKPARAAKESRKDDVTGRNRRRLRFFFGPHTARTMTGQKSGSDGMPGKYRPLPVGLELYDLESDAGERHNVADQQTEVMREMQSMASKVRQELGDKLVGIAGRAVRPAAVAP
jgi:hypothetical protein